MANYFELYTNKDELTAEDWNRLYQVLSAYIGTLAEFEVIVTLRDNLVRFFIGSKRDLGAVSNNLEVGVLQTVDEDEIGFIKPASKERFVSLVAGGNILSLKEKMTVKRSRELEMVRIKVRKINDSKAYTRVFTYFKDAARRYSVNRKIVAFFPAHLLEIDFKSSSGYLRKSPPKYLNIEKSIHILSGQQQGALFEVDSFPYFNQPHYLNLTDFEFDKHSFIVGASGSGKSKFIELLVNTLHNSPLKMNYRVVVIDPHAAIGDSWEELPDAKIMSFDKDTAELFPGAGTDITAATELTSTLFKSLLHDQFNPRLERVIRFSLYVLLTAQVMSLNNLKRFVSELDYRQQVLEHVKDHVPQNITHFFATDFNEIKTKYHNEAITPIIGLVDEMELQPAFVNQGDQSLAKLVNDNFLTLFSLNKVSMGEKVVKTVAGLIIQQVFLLAQARAFPQRVLLIIDEVSLVQNPALSQILAEARKFNLSIMLSQQYFGQVENDLQAAIFSNVINYYSFKVSQEDARMLEGNLNIELPKEVVEAEADKGINEADYRVKILTELSPRECIVRISAQGKILPAIKGKTVKLQEKLNAGRRPELGKYSPHELPEKFNEYKPVTAQPVQERGPQQPRHAEATPIADNAYTQPVPEISEEPPKNLSELLRRQSSSEVKQRKD